MKRLRHVNGGIDALDAAILQALSEDGRMAMKDLARRVGLSAPSVAERVRRLEDVGIIEGYGTRLNAQAIGLPLAAFIRIRPMPGELKRVGALLADRPEVIECDRVTGDDCFVARVALASVAELEALIDDLLPFASTNTSIIQSSPVKRRAPLAAIRSGENTAARDR